MWASRFVLVWFVGLSGLSRGAFAAGDDGGVDPVSSGDRQLVTGAPQHLQRVADNQPEGTAWVGIKPIDPYNGSSYPSGVTHSGDTITLDGSPVRLWFEVQFGGWRGELTTYQIAIDASTFSNGVGADLAIPDELCSSDADCSAVYGRGSGCDGGHCGAGFEDRSHPRLAILGLVGYPSTLTFGSSILPGGPTTQDDGGTWYAGTLVLDAIDAAGTYTIGILQTAATFMVLAGTDEIPIAEFRSAIVQVPEGRCCNLTDQTCLDGVTLGECNDQVGRTRFVEGATCDGVDCIPTDGACCDRRPGVGGFCRVLEEVDCHAAGLITFTLNAECEDIVCEEATGACCDSLTGSCTNDVFGYDCGGTHQVWSPDQLCSTASCQPVLGACCDARAYDPRTGVGGCADDVPITDCVCQTCDWYEAQACAEIDCPSYFEVIPAVSEWGLVVLALAMLVVVKVRYLYEGVRRAA